MIYRKETFVDLENGGKAIDRLESLNMIEGDENLSEKPAVTRYVAGIVAMIHGRQVPLNFEIPATDILDAFEKYDACAEAMVAKAKEEIGKAILRQTLAHPGPPPVPMREILH